MLTKKLFLCAMFAALTATTGLAMLSKSKESQIRMPSCKSLIARADEKELIRKQEVYGQAEIEKEKIQKAYQIGYMNEIYQIAYENSRLYCTTPVPCLSAYGIRKGRKTGNKCLIKEVPCSMCGKRSAKPEKRLKNTIKKTSYSWLKKNMGQCCVFNGVNVIL